jgi:hypothetical protein
MGVQVGVLEIEGDIHTTKPVGVIMRNIVKATVVNAQS